MCVVLLCVCVIVVFQSTMHQQHAKSCRLKHTLLRTHQSVSVSGCCLPFHEMLRQSSQHVNCHGLHLTYTYVMCIVEMWRYVARYDTARLHALQVMVV